MDHFNRRKFISGALIGGSIAVSGCTDGDSSQSEIRETPDDSDSSGRMEFEDYFSGYEMTHMGDERVEMSFNTHHNLPENEYTVEIQTFDYESEFNDETSGQTVHLVYEEVIDNSGGNIGGDDITIEIPVSEFEGNQFVDTDSFGFQIGVENPESGDIEIERVFDRSFFVYEGFDGEIHFTRGSAEMRNETEEEYQFKFISSIPLRRYSEDTGLNNLQYPVEFSISRDTMEYAERWGNPVGFVCTGGNLCVGYSEPREFDGREESWFNREVMGTISNQMQDALEKYDITNQYLQASCCQSLTRNILEFNQDWEYLDNEEASQVRFPEEVLWRGTGDCKEFTFLQNSLLHHLGFETSALLHRRNDAGHRYNYHHISGAVDIEFDDLPERYQDRLRDDSDDAHRYPDQSRTDVDALRHFRIDAQTGTFMAISTNQSVTSIGFREGSA